MYNLGEYLPDVLVPQYEAVRDQLVSLLELLGIAAKPPPTNKGPGTSPEVFELFLLLDALHRHFEDPEGVE